MDTLLGIRKTRVYMLTLQMSEYGLIEIVGRGAGKLEKNTCGGSNGSRRHDPLSELSDILPDRR